jgi:plastocyanin
MLSRRVACLVFALASASLACSSSTDYGSGGGGGGTPLVADVKIVSGASTKGANAFNPNPFTVALNGGASVDVKWGNGDAISHTVTQDGGTPLFNQGLAKGATFTFSFTQAGTYTYHCSIHPSMTGSIVVNP